MGLMGSQQGVVLKGTFAVWREHTEEAKRAHLKEEMLKIRDKNLETKRRMCAAMMGSQGTLMLKATFSAWQEIVAKIKQEKALGEMKANESAEYKENAHNVDGLTKGGYLQGGLFRMEGGSC